MNEEQRTFLKKLLNMVRKRFPGDPLSDEKQCQDFMAYINDWGERVKDKPTVRTWLLLIVHEYELRHDMAMVLKEGRLDREI